MGAQGPRKVVVDHLVDVSVRLHDWSGGVIRSFRQIRACQDPAGWLRSVTQGREVARPACPSLRRSLAELYGLAADRFWRRGGGVRLLWPTGSALGSRSVSAGVVPRRPALLSVRLLGLRLRKRL